MRAPSSQRIVDSPAVDDGLRVDGVWEEVGEGETGSSFIGMELGAARAKVQCVG